MTTFVLILAKADDETMPVCQGENRKDVMRYLSPNVVGSRICITSAEELSKLSNEKLASLEGYLFEATDKHPMERETYFKSLWEIMLDELPDVSTPVRQVFEWTKISIDQTPSVNRNSSTYSIVKFIQEAGGSVIYQKMLDAIRDGSLTGRDHNPIKEVRLREIIRWMVRKGTLRLE